SITMLRGSRMLCSIQKERLTRRKHHWGKLDDLRSVYAPRLACLDQPIDALVECYSSDRELVRLPEYEREIAETLTLAPGCERVRISLHVADHCSVLHPTPIDLSAVINIAGQGSPGCLFSAAWPDAASYPPHWW